MFQATPNFTSHFFLFYTKGQNKVKDQTCVVCCIPCGGCDKVYFGETKRSVEECIKEHTAKIVNNLSAVAERHQKRGHEPDLYNVNLKVLCRGDKLLLRKVHEAIEGFHVTSQQPNRASHDIHSRHVGSFFALSGIGKSHKICSHSLLLNLHEAKLHHSNNVINIYSLTASLTCSNKISKKLKHILLFFPGFSYTAPRKKYSTWRRHEVCTGCVPRRENPLYS